MPIDAIRKCTHELVDRFQETLGFLELGEHERALKALNKAVYLAHQLQRLVEVLDREGKTGLTE